MKNIISRTVAAMLILGVLLSGHAHAQVKHSPAYGIAYDARGWDKLSDRYIEKRARKIERKHGAAAASDWRFTVERLRHFGEWVDDEWKARVLAWSRCYDVSRVDARRLFITIEDATWTMPQYPELHYIWGTVGFDGHIRLAAWAFIPNRGWSVNAIDTLGWEFGNWIQMQLLGAPNDPNKEIGDSDPCRR